MIKTPGLLIKIWRMIIGTENPIQYKPYYNLAMMVDLVLAIVKNIIPEDAEYIYTETENHGIPDGGAILSWELNNREIYVALNETGERYFVAKDKDYVSGDIIAIAGAIKDNCGIENLAFWLISNDDLNLCGLVRGSRSRNIHYGNGLKQNES